MRSIDLHTHSTISDGTFTPRELAFYAKAHGLSAIALTDHDTIDGIASCQEAGRLVHLEVLAGIELTANYYGKEIHILGLGIDPSHTTLREQLNIFRTNREKRNTEVLKLLTQLGVPITLEDLIAQTGQKNIITRAHFARALTEKGYTASMDEAFDKFLLRGRPAYFPKISLSFTECIQLIHLSGGKAVVAHPMLYPFASDERDIFFKDLVEAGLDGIEVLYPKHQFSEMAYLMDVCEKYQLCHTGGSDFHGSNKDNIEIGVGYGQTFVPYALFAQFLQPR